MSDKNPKWNLGAQLKDPSGNMFIYMRAIDRVVPGLAYKPDGKGGVVKDEPSEESPAVPQAIGWEHIDRNAYGWVLVAGSMSAFKGTRAKQSAESLGLVRTQTSQSVPGVVAPKKG